MTWAKLSTRDHTCMELSERLNSSGIRPTKNWSINKWKFSSWLPYTPVHQIYLIFLNLMSLYNLCKNLCSWMFNQSTVSTAKRLASLFWYLIASTIDTLHNTLNGYEIACNLYGTRSKMYIYVRLKQMQILYFKNVLFLFLVYFKLRKSS